MSITLVSSARTVQTFNLTRDLAPVRHTALRSERQGDGSLAQVDARHVIPGSITLLANPGNIRDVEELVRRGIAVKDLDDRVESCQEVQAALKAGLVRVVRQKSVEKAPEKPADTPAVAEAKGEKSKEHEEPPATGSPPRRKAQN